MTAFRGVYTALVTPFTDKGGQIDLQRHTANLNRQSIAGVRGVVPCGTTGESPTLPDDEHKALVRHTIEIARPLGLQVIAGAGSNDTSHAIELHRFAHEHGADGSLQVSPYYNKPSQEGLYRHFSTIADSCDLPIVLYNIPGRTGVALTPETIERLAAHPNIVAIKDATGGLDTAGETILRTDLAVLSGDDPLTLPLLSIGGMGVISVLSNLLPDRVAAMVQAALDEGDWGAARTVHYELLPIAQSLLHLDSNPVPVKTALELLGLDSGDVRPPLAPASGKTREKIRQLLQAAGIMAGGTATTPAVAP